MGGNLERQGLKLMGALLFNTCFYFDLPPSFLCLGHIDEENIFCFDA